MVSLIEEYEKSGRVIEKIKNGDIILSSRDSFIVKFMRIFQSDPVRYGHTMIVVDGEYAFEAKLEIRKTHLYKILEKNKHYKIIRYKNLTEKQYSVMYKSLKKLIGIDYSFFRLFLQLLDHVFGTNYFTKLMSGNKSQVCSSLVAWAYYIGCRIKFNGVSWKSCDPDDIDDESIRNTGSWEVVEER